MTYRVGSYDIPVVVDPDLAGGAVLLRSDAEQLILAAPLGNYEEEWRRKVMADPLLMEDCLSLAESAPFIIRIDKAGDPMACERCGTLVMAVPEGAVKEDYLTRRYQRAIWESKTGRKHTLRRCEAMRTGKAA